MTVSLAQLEKFAADFYVEPAVKSSPSVPLSGDSGSYTLDKLGELMQLWADANAEFTFQAGRTSRGPGFHIRCPGDADDGWPDGARHTDRSTKLTSSATVWVENGHPRFRCGHSHCDSGAEAGKKTWKHLVEAWDPGGRMQRRVLCGTSAFEPIAPTQSKSPQPIDQALSDAEMADFLSEEVTPDAPQAPQAPQEKIETMQPESITEAPRVLPFTDLGNAERFVRSHGDSFRHTTARGWHSWDGTRWVTEARAAVVQAATKTVRAIPAEGDASPEDEELHKNLGKWARASESRTRIEAMIGLAQSAPRIATNVNDFDRDDFLLNAKNGTVDLRTGVLRKHAREDLLSAMAPVVVDPGAGCPQWLKFLTWAMEGDSEMVAFLARAVGYSLTGDTSEQCFFINHGSGANGKSTFVETVSKVLGDYSTTTPMNTFIDKKNPNGIPNDLAALRTSRMVISSEAEKTQKLAESLIKSLTGGEMIAARFLHGEFFQFQPKFKIWLSTNHRPQITGTDNGIWRRVKLIPWKVTISDDKKDRNLPAKLIAEASGILQWSLAGLAEYRLKGLMVPEKVSACTQQYREDEDALGRFLNQECEEGGQAPAAELYAFYKNWCEQGKERAPKLKDFKPEMERKGFLSQHTRKGAAYQGVHVRSGSRSV